MSRVKNISGGALDVPLLDRIVEDGEVVEVPDAQPDGSPVVWPPNRWEPVTDTTAKAAKADSASAKSDPNTG
jgi:hypothetical protein